MTTEEQGNLWLILKKVSRKRKFTINTLLEDGKTIGVTDREKAHTVCWKEIHQYTQIITQRIF